MLNINCKKMSIVSADCVLKQSFHHLCRSRRLNRHIVTIHYRPHPKDGEGTVFTGVCLTTEGGGGLPPTAHWSLVWGPFPGGGEGVPQSGHRTGVPPFPLAKTRTGIPTPSPPNQDQDRGIPLQAGPGQGYPPSQEQDRGLEQGYQDQDIGIQRYPLPIRTEVSPSSQVQDRGTPLPLPSLDRILHWQDTTWAVCLLHF